MLQIDEKMLIREVMKTRKRNWDQKLREKEQAEQRKRYLENQVEPGDSPSTDEGTTEPQNDGTTEQMVNGKWSMVNGQSIEVSHEEQRFYDMEQVIIQTIVRSGEQLLSFHRENNEPLTIMVIDYIFDELSAAGLTFRHPLYARMLNAAHDAARETDFVASRFFLNSADEAFSQTASRLISNSYDLPASGEQHEEKVSSDSVIRIVLEYKSLVVNAEMTKVMTQLSNPLIMNNAEQYMQLLQRQMQLTKEKKELAKQLGDRVVLK
jgi:hypothetical protein